jgi:hypothetical protein
LSAVGGAEIDGVDVVLKTDYWKHPFDFWDLKEGNSGDFIDLALDQFVGAKSSTGTAENAVDGVDSTMWISGGGVAPSSTQTFTVDLGMRSLINAIRVKWDPRAFASLYW